MGGTLYYDGALSDPIPIRKAFELGCERVVLLLTLPEATVRTPEKDEKLARRIRHRYPQAAKALTQRAERYNKGVALVKELAAQGKVLIVAPDDTCGVSTLTRDVAALEKLYVKGLRNGKKVNDFLQNG